MCEEVETTFHFMLTCKHVRIFWKIIERLLYYLFKINVNIDEKLLIIGYDLQNTMYDVLNLFCIIAQFTVYRNYIKCIFKGKKYNVNSLWVKFKCTMISYLESISKCNRKFGKEGDIPKILAMLC